MENKEALFKEYVKRFRWMKNVKNVRPDVLEKAILNAADGEEISERTLFNWVNGYRSIPPIGALAALAKCLGTSCGYLLGQHDLESFEIENGIVRVTMHDVKDLFRNICGHSLHSDSVVAPAWISDKQKKGIGFLDYVFPYLRIANKLDVCIDYLLGLTEMRTMKEFAFYNGEYSKELGGSILVKPDQNGKPEYGIITNNGLYVIVKSGDVYPIDEFRTPETKIARQILV